jgi:hypothetical protein
MGFFFLDVRVLDMLSACMVKVGSRPNGGK